MDMTRNERAQVAILIRHKKPELPCPAFFTPRNNNEEQSPSGENAYTEMQSWSCACK